MGGSVKKILGYAMIAVAVIGTIFAPQLVGAWKYLYVAGVMAMGVGGSMLLQQVAKKEMMDQLAKASSVSGGLQANSRTSQAPIPLVYGRQKVGGNYVYMKASGTDNTNLHCVIGLCEGEIDGIEEMYFDDYLVWSETSPSHNLATPYHEYFEMDYRLGTASQTHFSQITAIDSDFSDRYKHTAVVYLKLIYNQSVWQGLPRVNFVIRGRKVYDPRDTNTKWTQTGPLQLRDAMVTKRFGAGISSSKIDDIAIAEAANYCEVLVTRTSNIVIKEFIDNGWSDIHANNYLGAWGGAPFSGTAYWGAIAPGTLTVRCGGETYTDNGAGVLSGDYGGAGTVNYTNNAIVLTSCGAPPGSGDDGGDNGVYATFRDGWYHAHYTVKYPGVVPSSVSFSSSEESWTDNGAGVLTSSLGGSGTINYTTGAMEFTFKLPPPRDNRIVVSYSCNKSTRFQTNFFAVGGSGALDTIQELISQFRGMLIYTGGYYKLRIDKPETSVASFRSGGAEDAGNNIIDGSFSWSQAGISEIPTRVRAKWIDPIQGWKVMDYLVDLPGIGSERRELTLELYSVTHMDVMERIVLTQANLIQNDIKCNFKTMLSSVGLEPGDVVDVTHPAAGWTAKLFRVVGIEDSITEEQVSVSLVEYDAAAYIDDPPSVSNQPPTSVVPVNPNTPPPNVTGLTLTEFWKLMNDGTWSSWVRVTYTIPSNYPYLDAVELYLRNRNDNLDFQLYGETKSTTYEIGPLKEKVSYTIMVVLRSIYGVRMYPSGAVGTVTLTGKTGLPTNPTFISGSCSFTDRVILNWNPLADKDLAYFELRTDLNWGNATNLLYRGKGTSFWMPATTTSYTFYLKSMDTSGNYSSSYATQSLTNGAPTSPSTSTDYVGRDCFVKWDISPDLDFDKWELKIYSDSGRTTLKRTVVLQTNTYNYSYDQIVTDFGGAGAPGTIYFRLTVYDIFGSTTVVDFSATQASPAISQFDGSGVERVRIGHLGSSVYGARFKDSAGNITYEQGDTLKQQYMKIDELNTIQPVIPFHWPFGTTNDSGLVYSEVCFDGQAFLAIQNSNGHLWLAIQGDSGNLVRDLTDIYTPSGTIHGLSFWRDANNYELHIVLGTSNGLYYGVYRNSTGTWTTAMTLVENNTTRTHYSPRIERINSSLDQVVFMDAGNTNNIYSCTITKSTGAIGVGPTTTNAPAAAGYLIVGSVAVNAGVFDIIYRKASDGSTSIMTVAQNTGTGALTIVGPSSLGTQGEAGKTSACVKIYGGVVYDFFTWAWFHDRAALGNMDTLQVTDSNGTLLMGTEFPVSRTSPFSPISTSQNYGKGNIPCFTVQWEHQYGGVGRTLAFSMVKFRSYQNVTLQRMFTYLGF